MYLAVNQPIKLTCCSLCFVVVSLLKDLKHANIVTLHDIVHTQKSLTLVFEYLDRDLKQYMDDCGGIMSMTNVRVSTGQLPDQYRISHYMFSCHSRLLCQLVVY